MNDSIIKTKIIANCPVDIQGMGKIHTFTLKEIAEFNENDYFNILNILTSSVDDIQSNNLPQDFKYFDYIISVCISDENKRNQILKFLKYVFKDEIHFLPKNMCFFVGRYTNVPANEVATLDRDNFEIFSKILRIQYGIKEKAKKKKKTNSNLERLRKKSEEGNKTLAKLQGTEFSLENLISSLAVFLLDIDKALNLNFYQANNIYEKLLRKEKYQNDFKAYLSGADANKLSINSHWTKSAKI